MIRRASATGLNGVVDSSSSIIQKCSGGCKTGPPKGVEKPFICSLCPKTSFCHADKMKGYSGRTDETIFDPAVGHSHRLRRALWKYSAGEGITHAGKRP